MSTPAIDRLSHGAPSGSEEFRQPSVVEICQIIAWIMIAVGVFTLIDAIDRRWAGDEMAAAGMLLFGSVIWFAIARAVALLARIAHNTARPRISAEVATEISSFRLAAETSRLAACATHSRIPIRAPSFDFRVRPIFFGIPSHAG